MASYEFTSTTTCGNCLGTVPVTETSVRDWLDGPATCADCGEPFDLWTRMVAAAAEQNGFAMMPLGVGGPPSTAVSVTLESPKTVVDLRDHGVPEDANVLRVVHSVTSHPPKGELPLVVGAIPLQVAP